MDNLRYIKTYEELSPEKLVKASEYARKIKHGRRADKIETEGAKDMGWFDFRSMLEYKCKLYGKNLSVIGRFDPSSKTCSNCGVINKELSLNDREWTCKCGTNHDRDINAAKNIRNFGLRNKPSVTQSGWLHRACDVETHQPLADV